MLKRAAFVALAGVLGAGAWKLFLHTPIAPIPDCAWPNPFTGNGLFAGLFQSDMMTRAAQHAPLAVQSLLGVGA